MTSFKRNNTYVDEKKVRFLFEKYDENRNGTLERKEFSKIMKDIFKELNENLTEKSLNEAVEEGFKMFDTDKNKKLEFDEFYEFIRFLISNKGYEL